MRTEALFKKKNYFLCILGQGWGVVAMESKPKGDKLKDVKESTQLQTEQWASEKKLQLILNLKLFGPCMINLTRDVT
jgi:hypothetical protein